MSSHDSPTDDFSVSLGSLRSDITITLHTYHAVRIWNGIRRREDSEEGFHGIPGMRSFFATTNLIKLASGRDDPFADWWMIRLEERIGQAEQRMAELSAGLDTVMKRLPKQISLTDNLNQKPLGLPLFIGSHMGFMGVYLLESYDSLVRKALQANHVGLLGRINMESFIDKGARELRSLMELAQRYKLSGVSRDDMATNNARAREATERFGLPPQDILEGTRRSEFAPRIVKPKAAVPLRELRPALDDPEAEFMAAIEQDESEAGDA